TAYYGSLGYGCGGFCGLGSGCGWRCGSFYRQGWTRGGHRYGCYHPSCYRGYAFSSFY
uniref:Uncharacterized protein n=1 Tax=Ailuropoda melanoleuca TaxID=9646 RepID=A0A7N5JL94_AILME